MAFHELSDNFNFLFAQINPSATWVERASSQYNSIKTLIESAGGVAEDLKPRLFLQGSYGRDTAIYTINDVDVVALCEGLSYPPRQGRGRHWSRDEIFSALALPLLSDGRYRDKVAYGATSMCIKVNLGIKLEILPAVVNAASSAPNDEPFFLYRPERARWEIGYARHHQALLTEKNKRTHGNFIPTIKVMKHIRSNFSNPAVSFHIESLLYAVDDRQFVGSRANVIANVIAIIAGVDPTACQGLGIKTPCGDRDLFSATEWTDAAWRTFHTLISALSPRVIEAVSTKSRPRAVALWQGILGTGYFPGT